MLFMNYSRNVQKVKVTIKMQTALCQDFAKKLETWAYAINFVYPSLSSGTMKSDKTSAAAFVCPII